MISGLVRTGHATIGAFAVRCYAPVPAPIVRFVGADLSAMRTQAQATITACAGFTSIDRKAVKSVPVSLGRIERNERTSAVIGFVHEWRLMSRPDFIRNMRATFSRVKSPYDLACAMTLDSVLREQVKAAVTVCREWLAQSSGSHAKSMAQLLSPLADAWEDYKTMK